jgi:hypothetical protein
VKIALLGLLVFAGSAQANSFEFLYINASEGNSSGGHVAIQLGDAVYDYQYKNAHIRLFKHDANAFRVNYQLRQNRSIRSADIKISDVTYEQVSHYFKNQYFQQSQQLKQLQAAYSNHALLAALLQWKAQKPITPALSELLPRLLGAGLFYPDKNSPTLPKSASNCKTAQSSTNISAELKRQLANQYGKDFLVQKINVLKSTLSQLKPTVISELSSYPYAYSEHYSDLSNALLALQTLQTSQPLTTNSCFQIKRADMPINHAQIIQIRAFRQSLFRSAHTLIVSKRPDWGYALFITLARLIVIEHSLQSRHWTFLDDNDETVHPVSNQKLKLYPQHLQQQRHEDEKHLQHTMFALQSEPDLQESHYVEMEIAANRYQQWLNSDKTGVLAYKNQQAVPRKSLSLNDFLLTELSTVQLNTALHQQHIANDDLTQHDRKHSAYHVITKNCVTVLFEQINRAVSGQSVRLLGGFIDPQTTFIPFQAFAAVQNTYNVIKTAELPAYRQQALAKMYAREVDSWAYTREANIFSSRLYKHNPDDAWFVFFTDDTVLLRPLFGAVNMLAATSQSVYGLTRWPFDNGKTLKIGARGMLASLPELLFFNIRKGSYPYPIESYLIK